MESIHNFVISRAKISRSSVKVNDLFFTYNGENLQEDLTDVVEVANEKFTDLNDLNGATVTNLVHLFNEDEIKTCYFMCAISLIGKIDNKEFKLDFSSKRGNFLTVKSVIVESKNDVNEKDVPEEQKDVVGDENAPKDNQEETKDEDVVGGEANDENAPEESKNEEESGKPEETSEESKNEEESGKSEETSEEPKDEKKKVKDEKKKKAAKDASDKL